MDRINLLFYFEAGQRIGRLAALRVDAGMGSLAIPLQHAANALQALLDSEHPPLVKARPQAQALLTFTHEALDIVSQNPLYRLQDANLINRGDHLWSAFTTAMEMELPFRHVFQVAQTLAWDTDILVDMATAMFPENIRARLTGEALNDWRQAGRCMAFDLYTAAGFHTIRASEAMIRLYYEHIVGSLPPVKNRNWGAYTRVLRTQQKADSSIIALIDSIKATYRNPIMHPEATLTKDMAAILLSVCIGLVVQIVNAL